MHGFYLQYEGSVALGKVFDTEEIFEKGKSAYEIALENGFEGTEQEWLKSLQGETPYIGKNGNWFVGTLDTNVSAIPKLEDTVWCNERQIVLNSNNGINT